MNKCKASAFKNLDLKKSNFLEKKMYPILDTRVEEKVRNLAAHDIVSLESNDIKMRTGFTPVQIMDMIKKLFSYTNFSIKSEYWNSYEDMNEELKRRISEHREEDISC